MTMHLRDKLAELMKKLAYVQSVLARAAGLATWEKREYEALQTDYAAEITDTQQRIAAMNEQYGVSGW